MTDTYTKMWNNCLHLYQLIAFSLAWLFPTDLAVMTVRLSSLFLTGSFIYVLFVLCGGSLLFGLADGLFLSTADQMEKMIYCSFLPRDSHYLDYPGQSQLLKELYCIGGVTGSEWEYAIEQRMQRLGLPADRPPQLYLAAFGILCVLVLLLPVVLYLAFSHYRAGVPQVPEELRSAAANDELQPAASTSSDATETDKVQLQDPPVPEREHDLQIQLQALSDSHTLERQSFEKILKEQGQLLEAQAEELKKAKQWAGMGFSRTNLFRVKAPRTPFAEVRQLDPTASRLKRDLERKEESISDLRSELAEVKRGVKKTQKTLKATIGQLERQLTAKETQAKALAEQVTQLQCQLTAERERVAKPAPIADADLQHGQLEEAKPTEAQMEASGAVEVDLQDDQQSMERELEQEQAEAPSAQEGSQVDLSKKGEPAETQPEVPSAQVDQEPEEPVMIEEVKAQAETFSAAADLQADRPTKAVMVVEEEEKAAEEEEEEPVAPQVQAPTVHADPQDDDQPMPDVSLVEVPSDEACLQDQAGAEREQAATPVGPVISPESIHLQQVLSEREQLMALLASTQDQLRSLDADNRQMHSEGQSLWARANELALERDRLQSANDELRRYQEGSDAQVTELRTQIGKLEDEVRDHMGSADLHEALKEDAQGALKSKTMELEGCQRELQSAAEKLKRQEGDLVQGSLRFGSLSSENSKLQDRVDSLQADLTRLEDQQAQERNSALKAVREEWDEEEERLVEQVNELERENGALEGRLNQLRAVVDDDSLPDTFAAYVRQGDDELEYKLKALKWELNKARHEAREERLAKEEALRSADQARRQATQGGAFNDPDDSRARYLNASRTSPFTVITGRR